MKNKITPIQQQLKTYKISARIMTALNVSLVITIGILLLVTFPSSYDNLKIDYTDLNSDEIKEVEGIMGNLNPLYTQFVKEVIFTHHITNYCKTSGCSKNCKDGWCSGFNRDQKIVVQYVNNEEWLSQTICHEILHSIIIATKETHKIVYDLEEQGVCYR